jgi:RNA recognition motif-containing protein
MDELEELFSQFGVVIKVTFICDKYSSQFKGYILNLFRTAYVEFDKHQSKENAKDLHNYVYKDKAIRVNDMMAKISTYDGRKGRI